MSESSEEYVDRLSRAWEGELAGEAFFLAVAEHTASEEQERKWLRLARLERTIAGRLEVLLAEVPEDESPRDFADTEKMARNYAAMPFDEALTAMMTVLDEAISRFERLLDLAPTEDRQAVRDLVDHEIALKRFAELELSGDGARSLEMVDEVIRRVEAQMGILGTSR